MNDKIAILILCHKNVSQIKRLVNALDYSKYDLFIHIDKKSSISETSFANLKNIKFVTKQISCYLNTFSVVESTLLLMREAYKINEYMYYILLSGQDYPIKSNDCIYNYLKDNYPTEYIDITTVKENTWCSFWGKYNFCQKPRQFLFDLIGPKYYFSKLGSVLRIPIKLIDYLSTFITGSPKSLIKQEGLIYAAGSHFFMLTDNCIESILNMSNNKLTSIFNYAQTPEESYFQTCFTSSYLEKVHNPKKYVFDDNPLVDRMDRRSTKRLIFDYRDGVSSGHPFNFREKDFYLITKAQALFARKFDIDEDWKILDMIDDHIRI